MNIQTEVMKELNVAYPCVEKQNTLPKMLSEIADATGNKFIVIIDEWDALFREAKDDITLQEAYIQLLRGLFKSSLTDINSKDDVLTLLVHLGYLAYDIDNKTVYIPNDEVREEFVRAVTAGQKRYIKQ
ncbi:MAG: hypothetical protein IJZ34_12245 [Lachnospiraceae bacterium]|nr:hypothetical protein [Lachnospiraceae bacterium]